MARRRIFNLPGGTTPERIDALLAGAPLEESVDTSFEVPDLTGFEVSNGQGAGVEVPAHLQFFRVGDFGITRPVVASPLLNMTVRALVWRIQKYAAAQGMDKSSYAALNPNDPRQLEIDLMHGSTGTKLTWRKVPEFINRSVLRLPEGTHRLSAYLGRVIVTDRLRKGSGLVGARVALGIVSPVVEAEKERLYAMLRDSTALLTRPRMTPICTLANLPPIAPTKRRALQFSLNRYFATLLASELTEQGAPIECGEPLRYLNNPKFD